MKRTRYLPGPSWLHSPGPFSASASALPNRFEREGPNSTVSWRSIKTTLIEPPLGPRRSRPRTDGERQPCRSLLEVRQDVELVAWPGSYILCRPDQRSRSGAVVVEEDFRDAGGLFQGGEVSGLSKR